VLNTIPTGTLKGHTTASRFEKLTPAAQAAYRRMVANRGELLARLRRLLIFGVPLSSEVA